MKKIILLFFVILVTRQISLGQNSAVVQLQQLKGQTELIKPEIANARKAANTLIKQLSLTTGQPNVAMFETQAMMALNHMVDGVDNMYYYLNEALLASSNGFNPANLQSSIGSLSGARDLAQDLVAQIVASAGSGNKTLALTQLAAFNSQLTQASRFNSQIASKADAAINVVRPYQVCIRLVDANGNPTSTSDLFGYYAYSAANNAYYYPDNQEGTCFTLSKGTYTFDAYDGYWSGTGAKTITLKRSLENADGIIVVDLVLWSE